MEADREKGREGRERSRRIVTRKERKREKERRERGGEGMKIERGREEKKAEGRKKRGERRFLRSGYLPDTVFLCGRNSVERGCEGRVSSVS